MGRVTALLGAIALLCSLMVSCSLTPASTTVPVLSPSCTSIGQTWTRPADRMTMVCVPAGDFLMGSVANDAEASSAAVDAAKPQHTVTLAAFWVDQTEVTNGQYGRCVATGACTASRYKDNANYNGADQPVVGVRWYDAVNYCVWAGGRLPTEAEWEKAARGTDGRIYPWGNTFDGRNLNYCDANCWDCHDLRDGTVDDGYVYTAPVGSYPAGASPYGALDLAGNVWEWTSSLYAAYPYRADDGREDQASRETRMLRGGGWCNNAGGVRSARRVGGGPLSRDDFLGFRCVVQTP